MSDLVGGLQNRIGQFDPGIALKYKVVISKLTSIIGSNPIFSAMFWKISKVVIAKLSVY